MLERLDPRSLEVAASVAIVGPVAVAATEDAVWVMNGRGTLQKRDPGSLDLIGSVELGTSGPAWLAPDGGRIWTLGGQVGPVRAIVTAVDAVSVRPIEAVTVPGSATVGAIAIANGTWVGTLGSEPGTGNLVRIGDDGSFGSSTSIGSPVALVFANAALWWVSADGRLGAVGTDGAALIGAIRVGNGASSAIEANGILWIATERLVVVDPAP
ncbi:MAG: hypothetical protein ACOYXS_05865 [Chloroflexota bacterium]